MPTDEERIIEALKRAEMSKTDLFKITGLPYGPLGHVLNILILKGRVEKVGLRYKLKKGVYR